ncbi:hypothetical protein NFI96_005482 [Prochilodus magdalenae]|nr:hypothetical protein NFI96_005482 [Prochilodus magdalenae]
MTQQEQNEFRESCEDALSWMQAVQERLRLNDNTQGPRAALEARLRETEKIHESEQEGRLKMDMVLAAADVLLNSGDEETRNQTHSKLKELKALWEETSTYIVHCHRWTVRDDSPPAAAQCSVGHPLVLHQWTQDAAHRTLPTGRCPQDAAHRTPPTGRCPQDPAHRTLPTGRCPQDPAHRTLPTGRCPQDAAHRTLPTGRCPQDPAHRTLPTGRCPQDPAHRTLPHRTLRIEWVWLHWSEYLKAHEEFNTWLVKMERTLEPQLELQLGLREKLWQLDHHRVLCSDVKAQAQLMDRLVDEAAALYNRTQDTSVDENAQDGLQEAYNSIRAKAECPVGSVLWAASCGQRPVGQRPVGQRPVSTDEGLEVDQHCTVQQQMSYRL